jgi:RNA polymerase sigma-70 factor, ECF subfamily
MNDGRNTDEFVRLFSLFTNSIYSYIHVMAPTHADAEDLFQETSRTLWEKFGEYRGGPDEGFRAWALRIAQIEVLRHRQREGRRRRLFAGPLFEALDQATLAAVEAIGPRLDTLDDCYRKLPEGDRHLIDARYQAGASVEGIAAQEGRSVHSIYRALRRIHELLFDCVQNTEKAEKGIGPIYAATNAASRRPPEGRSGQLDLPPFPPTKERTP